MRRSYLRALTPPLVRPLVTAARAVAIAGALTACGPVGGQSGPPAVPGSAAPVHPVAVSADDFPTGLHELLIQGDPSSDRMNLLAGVVRQQLARAQWRFERGYEKEGLAAVIGALYLVRPGELQPEMLAGGAPAIAAAAEAVARLGDEGRARALYELLLDTGAGSTLQRDTRQHLEELDRWIEATTTRGSLRALGNRQRAAVRRALIQPNPETAGEAKAKTFEWLQRTFEASNEMMPPRSHFEQDETYEVFRGRRAGGPTLVALYLRFGDPQGALDALDAADVPRLISAPFHEALESAAVNRDPEAWWSLFSFYSQTDSPDPPDVSIDPELASAAAWGSALELYRADPNGMRSALALAEALMQLEMGEAAPIALTGALGANPGPREASAALSVLHHAIVSRDAIGDTEGARRIFEASAPIISLAESQELVGRVRPSAARLRYVIGAIQTRAGALDLARPHVARSLESEPSIAGFQLLAAIDRQRGNAEAALKSLTQAQSLANAGNDPLAEAESLVTAFEIHRDRGASGEAASTLERALRRTLDARQLVRSAPAIARAERLLARIADYFGATDAAARATERAYEAAGANLREISATTIEHSRRALTHSDMKAARAAARQALEADLDDDDLVYVALWLHLVEGVQSEPGDGTVQDAFADIDDDERWPSTLRDWGRGDLDDDALVKAARSVVERTEADFYVAMGRRVAGDEQAALAGLRAVAQSPAIDLVEVTIARDLVARARGHQPPTLPSDIKLP